MKKIGLTLTVLLGLIVLYVLYIMNTTGYFRTIEGAFEKDFISQVPLKGPEDIVINREDEFLIVSSDDRAGHRDQRANLSCGLYIYDLKNGQVDLLTTNMDHEVHPHGIDLMRLDSGVYRLLVVNHIQAPGEEYAIAGTHIKHFIEEFRLEGRKLIHIKSHEAPEIKSPNDVTIVDETQFYFTNDHGSDTELGLLAEDYLGIKRSEVIFYNGTDYKKVAGGIAYANGIAWHKKRDLLFVASPRDFLIKVYKPRKDGDLDFIENIPCGTGVDNIEIDENGDLLVGCHPSLLHFTSYAKGSSKIAPSEILRIAYQGKNDFTVQAIAEDDGSSMSAATVAIRHKEFMYLGNVMDNHMVILQDKK